MKGNSQPSPGSAESPRQDKHNEKHTKTHSNKLARIKDKEKLLKATGKNNK